MQISLHHQQQNLQQLQQQYPEQPQQHQEQPQQHQEHLQQTENQSAQSACTPVMVQVNQRRLPEPCPVTYNCLSDDVIKAIDSN